MSHLVRASFGLYLCEAPIDEQLRTRDVAAIVGREKYDGLCDFLGCAESAQRNAARDHLPAFLAGGSGSQQITEARRLDGGGAHGVHADAPVLQIRGPGPRE